MTTHPHRPWQLRSSWPVGVICWASCVMLPLIARSQESGDVTADVAIVRPFVGETTFCIVKLDASRLSLPDLTDTLEPMSAESRTAYLQMSRQATVAVEQLRVLVDDQPIYATFGVPLSESRLPTYVFVKKPSDTAVEKLFEFLKNRLGSKAVIHGDYVVATPVNDMDVAKSLDEVSASPREATSDAFASVAGYPLQMLFLPPSHVWRAVNELSPELPRQLGGGSSRVLTEGLQWAALGVDPAQLRAEFVIHSSSDTAARDLAAHLPEMLRSAYDAAPQIQKQIPEGLSQALIGWLSPQVEGKRITIRMDGLQETSANLKLLAVIAQTIEERTRRRTNRNRFKHILLAMHNYYDGYKGFPPADRFRGKDGKHHLSWRVHILPYIDEQQHYDEFHLDEAWDSPHNAKLMDKMPDVYKTISFDIPATARIKPAHTTFLAPVGEDTVFGGAESTKFHNVRDGTSNTIVLVEVRPEQAVPWTAPVDYAFDPEDPAAGILVGGDGKWLSGFADGSVHQLRADTPAGMLLHLFQMSDANVIDHNRIH